MASAHMAAAARDEKYGVVSDEDKKELQKIGAVSNYVRMGKHDYAQKKKKRRQAIKGLKTSFGGRFPSIGKLSGSTQG